MDQSKNALSSALFARVYMKAAQAATAKAGQERLANVRCRTISTNIGLKIPLNAIPKELMLSSVICVAFEPPPVTMYVSMPVRMTIQIQMNAPVAKPKATCRPLLRTL